MEAESLAERVNRIRPSPTIAVSTLAKELKAAGKDVINLGTGEPDFDTPEHIKEAARKAIADGQTKYTAVPGTLEIREAICRKLVRDNAMSCDPAQIVVTNGAKQAIMNLLQCVVKHDDEVVIPAPYWVSYPDIAQFCGGKPVFVFAPVESGHKITAEQLDKAMGDNTRVVMLNSPCNPSGCVYTEGELKALGEVIAKYPKALVCSDEIYEHVTYSGKSATSFAAACPDLIDRTVIVNGVAKAYAMTGWRVGFSASSETLAKAMSKVQSQSTSNVCSIAQAAAAVAFDSDLDCIKPMLDAFGARRSRVVSAYEGIEGLTLPPIDGAFYAFGFAQVAINNLHEAGKIESADDEAYCRYLLKDFGVAAVPGTAFGSAGSFRISFAADDEQVDAALERIARSLS